MLINLEGQGIFATIRKGRGNKGSNKGASKIKMRVSVDDIKYALKKKTTLVKLLDMDFKIPSKFSVS